MSEKIRCLISDIRCQMKKHRRLLMVLSLGLLGIGALFILAARAHAAQTPTFVFPSIKIEGKPAGPKLIGQGTYVLLMMTFLSLAPYLFIMTTSFVRVIIVLSFIRSALGTQGVPPTQVLMGLALFLTFFIMAPVGTQVNNQAIRPAIKGEISMYQAIQKSTGYVSDFMLRQVQKEDLALFYDIGKIPRPETKKDVPLYVLMPAFMLSEVKIGFEMGFLIYIPFLVIDMVVASVLMSMGMFMLSPMVISLPFKLLLFVMVDGWELIIKGLVSSFH